MATKGGWQQQQQEGWAPWEIPGQFASSIQARIDGVREQVNRTQQQFDRTVPELQRLAESPGLSDMVNEIGRGLLTRLSARVLQVVLREDPKKKQ